MPDTSFLDAPAVKKEGDPVPYHRLSRITVILFVVLTAVGGTLGGWAADVAGAGEPSPSSLAWFEGDLIDLQQGWGEARACVVWGSDHAVECYRSERERDAAAGTDEIELTAFTHQCSSWFTLYEYTYGGGRSLQFRDRGYWQNLGTWGFDNQTSSFRTRACPVWLAGGANGSGAFYPGTTSAWHYEPVLISGWDNRISSLYIR